MKMDDLFEIFGEIFEPEDLTEFEVIIKDDIKI